MLKLNLTKWIVSMKWYENFLNYKIVNNKKVTIYIKYAINRIVILSENGNYLAEK